MRVRIRKTIPDGEVGMREILVKAFLFDHTHIRYFVVKGKTDDYAYHRVRDWLKKNVGPSLSCKFWYSTVKKNTDEYANGYLKATYLN